MRRNHVTQCAVAFAAAVALLVAFGVRTSSVLYVGAVLACPLLMLFMMRGMTSRGGRTR